MKRILIVEDEAPLAEALKFTLSREGYEVEVAQDGASGLDFFERGGADLILLDLMLPVVDGLEVCRRIRSRSEVPILMLTAKDSELDEILGLELGADDYITKPFSTRNLIARIRAVLRRSEANAKGSGSVLDAGPIVMDLDRHAVSLEENEIHLTPIEYRLLELLIRKKGKALSREYLMNNAWEEGFFGSPKTLDVHIRHLRTKVETDPDRPEIIITVRGVGYRLQEPGGGDRP